MSQCCHPAKLARNDELRRCNREFLGPSSQSKGAAPAVSLQKPLTNQCWCPIDRHHAQQGSATPQRIGPIDLGPCWHNEIEPSRPSPLPNLWLEETSSLITSVLVNATSPSRPLKKDARRRPASVIHWLR